ncbi:hypothetical protein V1477_016699 [Vespula maculifrons]|uniref:Uncharacterized protein n=1 Tax=Vespula maculifrons TaxID=7453 RepID=A0ABD2B3V3_VESMC
MDRRGAKTREYQRVAFTRTLRYYRDNISASAWLLYVCKACKRFDRLSANLTCRLEVITFARCVHFRPSCKKVYVAPMFKASFYQPDAPAEMTDASFAWTDDDNENDEDNDDDNDDEDNDGNDDDDDDDDDDGTSFPKDKKIRRSLGAAGILRSSEEACEQRSKDKEWYCGLFLPRQIFWNIQFGPTLGTSVLNRL